MLRYPFSGFHKQHFGSIDTIYFNNTAALAVSAKQRFAGSALLGIGAMGVANDPTQASTT